MSENDLKDMECVRKQGKKVKVKSWDPKSMWTMTEAMKLKDACSLEEKLWQT